MIENSEGNSDLARLARQLPARGRIGLTAMLAYLALNRLRGLPDYPLAKHAFELTRRWFDGERFDPDRFEDTLQDEDNEGIGKFEHVAPTKEARAAWTLLGDAVAYTAFLAYQTTGQHPSPGICDVDESCLDDFDRLNSRRLAPIHERHRGSHGVSRGGACGFFRAVEDKIVERIRGSHGRAGQGDVEIDGSDLDRPFLCLRPICNCLSWRNGMR